MAVPVPALELAQGAATVAGTSLRDGGGTSGSASTCSMGVGAGLGGGTGGFWPRGPKPLTGGAAQQSRPCQEALIGRPLKKSTS